MLAPFGKIAQQASRHHYRWNLTRSFVSPHKPLPSQPKPQGTGKAPPDHITESGKWNKHDIESIDFDEPNVEKNYEPRISPDAPSGEKDVTDADVLENIMEDKAPKK